MDTKKTSNNHTKSFWKDKKNIAIIILAFLTLCFLMAYADSDSYKSQEQITELENQINTLKSEVEGKNNQITDLQNSKSQLEDENANLASQVDELQKISQNTNLSSINSSEPQTSTDTNTEMVWVGETGTKYHNQNCRTLKGNGHQITLKQALSEGREPCKVCY